MACAAPSTDLVLGLLLPGIGHRERLPIVTQVFLPSDHAAPMTVGYSTSIVPLAVLHHRFHVLSTLISFSQSLHGDSFAHNSPTDGADSR